MAGQDPGRGQEGLGGAGWEPSAASLALLYPIAAEPGRGAKEANQTPEFWSMRAEREGPRGRAKQEWRMEPVQARTERRSRDAPRRSLEWQVLGYKMGEGRQSLILEVQGDTALN